MGNDSLALASRWWIFTRERFPLASHLAMTVVFTLANVGLAGHAAGVTLSAQRVAIALLLTLSFLFRLRCFDEIKDYRTDLRLNPHRPLPRGVLTLRQVKVMIGVLTVAEIVLAFSCGMAVLASHLLALAYSFLMYREFFIGAYLRPRLTTYAVTHTFSLLLLGWSLASLALGKFIVQLPIIVLLFGLVNWMLFNVFEFARKSWAAGEETPGADSYTLRYGIPGAVLLTLSQVVVALLVLAGALRVVVGNVFMITEVIISLVLASAGLSFMRRPQPTQAKIFRLSAAVFLLLFYLLLLLGMWG